MKKSSSKNKSGNHRANHNSSKGRNGHSMAASNSRNGRSRSTSSRSRSQARSTKQPLNEKWLKDFLSEMHTVEEGGEKLYQKALDELQHEELRDKLEEFHQETQRHIELMQEMLEVAGVEEGYKSPAANAAEQKAEGLLSVKVEDEELLDMNNIENLVLAETKDHWNWEMMKSIAGQIEDRELRDVAKRAVAEVFKQEQEHLTWNQDRLTELAMEKAQEQGPAADSEDMEEGEELSR